MTNFMNKYHTLVFAANFGVQTNQVWLQEQINLRGYPDGYIIFNGVRGAGQSHLFNRLDIP